MDILHGKAEMTDNDITKAYIVYFCEVCGRSASRAICDLEETEPSVGRATQTLNDGKVVSEISFRRTHKLIGVHYFCQEHTREPIEKPFFKNEQEEEEWCEKKREIEQVSRT